MLDQAIRANLPREFALRHVAIVVGDVSDSDVVVEAALRQLQARDCGLRSITCEHYAGMLILRGCVSSYYLKQLAQESVRKLPGVEMIDNAVDVVASNRLDGCRPIRPDFADAFSAATAEQGMDAILACWYSAEDAVNEPSGTTFPRPRHVTKTKCPQNGPTFWSDGL